MLTFFVVENFDVSRLLEPQTPYLFFENILLPLLKGMLRRRQKKAKEAKEAKEAKGEGGEEPLITCLKELRAQRFHVTA